MCVKHRHIPLFTIIFVNMSCDLLKFISVSTYVQHTAERRNKRKPVIRVCNKQT
jgi:hypothetical protein